jgi:hypothetical protein
VNHRIESKHRYDQERFGNVKTQSDVLKKQLHDIHEEWGGINLRSPDRHLLQRQNDMADRESKVLGEFRQLLGSADEVLGRILERSR